MSASHEDRNAQLSPGVAIKAPCRAATTAAITLSGEQTVDGVALIEGDRCLVKNQASSVDNGIYTVSTGTWTRAQDFDGTRDVVLGTFVFITSGATNINTFFECTTTGTVVFGTSNITFAVGALGPITLPLSMTNTTFTQTGTGATARTGASKFGDVISVKDFGAVGDGATDDTAAFNAAILYAHTNGGTLVVPNPSSTYLLLGALDCTFATGANQKGFVIRGEGSTSLDATTFLITAKHTGHVFDCAGAAQITFENISVGTDASTYPKTCFFLARNSTGGSIQGIRFNNVRVSGKFSNSVMYNYGSEDDVHVGNFWVNFATDAGAKVCRWTGNNVSSLSSTFITIATGARSTTDHSVFGGQYHMQSGDAAADVFELESCDSLKVYGPWMYCGTVAANGRSLVFVNTANSASSYCVLHGIMGENSTFMQQYGVYFGDTAKTPTGWTIASCRFPNQTKAIFAHANVTLDNFLIDAINEQGSNGMSAAGTVQNSILRVAAMVLVIGTSKNNTVDGFSENWTITTRNNDNWRDQGITNKTFTPAAGTLTHGGVLTFADKSCLFHGNLCSVFFTMSDTVSFTVTAGQTITGLPKAAAHRSSMVCVTNATGASLGVGAIISGTTTILLPAFTIAVPADVIVSCTYPIA